MRNKRNPMIMNVNIKGIGLEEAEMNWVEVRENLKGKRFLVYRGDERRIQARIQGNAQRRMVYMFGSYFNSLTEMGKRNPGLYEKLVDDERAVAGLI